MKKREIYKRIMGLSLGLCLAFSLNMSANAQTCTAAPSCDSLGYTKSASDCSGEYLKCPFDNNKVFCGSSSSSCGGGTASGDELICTPNDCSTYTASSCPANGTCAKCSIGCGNSSPSKYKLTKCNPGYQLAENKCVAVQLAAGYVLHADKSISAEPVFENIPIAVVFDAEKKLAVALTQSSSAMTWGPTSPDISGLENCTSSSTVTTTCGTDGKSNTQTIIAQEGSYPAAEYCNTYKTTGTSAGDWWLPSMKELDTIYTNKTAIDANLAIIGTILGESSYWSSTENTSNGAWTLYMSYGGTGDYGKSDTNQVRPVVAF